MPTKQHASKDSNKEKELIYAIRNEFFDDLLEQWSKTPQKIDTLMGQADGFFDPDYKIANAENPVMIKDVEHGILAVSVTPRSSTYQSLPQNKKTPHSELRWIYSIMQAGDWLRYGILIQGDPRRIIEYQKHHDHILNNIERIWDRSCDYQFRDGSGLLLEWRFVEPDFYSSFICRERFKLIARHLHFRLGKIMRSLLDGEYSEDIITDFSDNIDNITNDGFEFGSDKEA